MLEVVVPDGSGKGPHTGTEISVAVGCINQHRSFHLSHVSTRKEFPIILSDNLNSVDSTRTVMRHLCISCAGLQVCEDVDLETFQKLRVFKWPHSIPTLSNLIDSAAGISDGKSCHFCAILLRSLKDHRHIGTKNEHTSLPKGPIALYLSGEKEDDFAIIAKCDESSGHPINLDLGAG
jgi:hypothetical protein